MARTLQATAAFAAIAVTCGSLPASAAEQRDWAVHFSGIAANSDIKVETPLYGSLDATFDRFSYMRKADANSDTTLIDCLVQHDLSSGGFQYREERKSGENYVLNALQVHWVGDHLTRRIIQTTTTGTVHSTAIDSTEEVNFTNNFSYDAGGVSLIVQRHMAAGDFSIKIQSSWRSSLSVNYFGNTTHRSLDMSISPGKQ